MKDDEKFVDVDAEIEALIEERIREQEDLTNKEYQEFLESLHEEEPKEVSISPLENMDKAQLDAYSEVVMAAREHERWQTMEQMPLVASRIYTEITNPENWQLCREKMLKCVSERNKRGWDDSLLDIDREAKRIAVEIKWWQEQKYIEELNTAFPLNFENPNVRVLYSDRFPSRNKMYGEELLSLAAAEHIFKKNDAITYINNKIKGYDVLQSADYIVETDTKMNPNVIKIHVEDQYNFGRLNGGLIKNTKRQNEVLSDILTDIVKNQEQNPQIPIIQQPEIPKMSRIDFTEALRLASEEYPIIKGTPYVVLESKLGEATGSIRGANKALMFLDEKQKWENEELLRYTARKEIGKIINVAYTITNGTKVYAKGNFLLGNDSVLPEKSFLKETKTEKLAEAEKVAEKEYLKTFPGRLKQGIRKIKKKVMLRNTSTNTKGMSR